MLRSDKEIEAEQDLNSSHLPILHCLPLHEERTELGILIIHYFQFTKSFP